MGRTTNNNTIVNDTYDSVLEQINIFLKELNDLSKKAKRDYNEAKKLAKADKQAALAVEDIRKNSLNTLQKYFELRLKVIQLHLEVSKYITDTNEKKKKVDEGVEKHVGNFSQMKDMVDKLKSEMNK